MTKLFGRVALLTFALGAVAAPAPAFADIEELRACFANCREAYQVQTQQPEFYNMCRNNCIALYDNATATPDVPNPLAVIRYH
jgi:hypothetical protein